MGAIRRLFTFLIVLVLAVGGLYIWWQVKARGVITAAVQEQSCALVANPANLQVDMPKPVTLIGLGHAMIPALTIKGKDLVLKDGPAIKQMKITLQEVEVSGPPFHFAGVSKGYYTFTVQDSAVTAYLRKRGVKIGGFGTKIPLDTLTVTFSKAQSTVLNGEVILPIFGHVPLTARGQLIPSSRNGEIDFKVHGNDVSFARQNIGVGPVLNALSQLNPVVTVAEWPFLGDIDGIATTNGAVTIHGHVTAFQR